MRPLVLLALASLSTTLWAAENYAIGAPKDPTIRVAQFDAASGRHYSALSELLSIPTDTYRRLPAGADYRWALADNYLSFGMNSSAEGLYRDLSQADGSADHLPQARLRLADFDYQRGYENEARNILTDLRDRLPQSLLIPWQEQTARALMADRRYAEAIDVFTRYNNLDKQSEYSHYNLGIAQINIGKLPEGRQTLDDVGDMSVDTSADLALRDKANLTLGWHYLGQKMGPEAKDMFGRIRSRGPYSNKALLGLGWAELLAADAGKSPNAADKAATGGAPDPISTLDSLANLLRPGFLDGSFFSGGSSRLGKVSSEEEGALRRALVAWVELMNRNPMDPAVNEAWLAIPYTLNRIGAHEQALRYYELAVTKLEDARKRAETAMGSIRQGRMVETIIKRDPDDESGWDWELKDLPDAPETYYLQNLIAEHRFQEALKSYRDLKMLSRNLDGWKQRLDAMQAKSTGQGQPDVEPEVLFQRIRTGFVPPWPAPTIPLRLETDLAPPGSYDAPLPPAARSKMPLQIATPKHIETPWEQAQALRTRLKTLQPAVDAAAAQQAGVLRELSLTELDGQKKQIEKYLAEARFALARLYDKKTKGALGND